MKTRLESVLGSITSIVKSFLPFQSQRWENSCTVIWERFPTTIQEMIPGDSRDLLLTVGMVFLLYLLTTGNVNLYATSMEICKHEDGLVLAQLLHKWAFRKHGFQEPCHSSIFCTGVIAAVWNQTKGCCKNKHQDHLSSKAVVSGEDSGGKSDSGGKWYQILNLTYIWNSV